MDKLITRQEANDLNLRLRVFRKALDDFGNAVNFANGVDEEYLGKTKEIVELRKRLPELQEATAKAKAEHTAAVQNNQLRVSDMDKSFTKATKVKQVKLDELSSLIAEGEEKHSKRMEAMEKEYAGRLATLKSNEAKEAAALQRTKDQRERYRKEAMAG